ncbi:MAG TPA: hypothetical protein VH560_12915 [Polyangia bacterium]|jgi:hypothetical protein|nr:hypothetical protein [Polyangia bacterium]
MLAAWGARMHKNTALAASIALLFALPACAPEVLPPAAVPSREVPRVAMPESPPAPDHGRVILDAPSRPASVARLTGTGTGTTPRGYALTVDTHKDICRATPCVVDLKKGPQTLLFTPVGDPDHVDQVQVDVGDAPLVVRHENAATDVPRAHDTAVIFAIGGAGLIGVGAVATAAGAAMASAADDKGLSGSRNVEDTGIGTLIGGGVFVVGGLIAQALMRGTMRDGATTQFTLPGAASAQPIASGPPALLRF